MKKLIMSFLVVVLFLGMAGIAMAYSIKDDATGGDCTSIGIWDWATKTCTLTQDIYATPQKDYFFTGTINIDSDNIILDGNGHTITGACGPLSASPNVCGDPYTGLPTYGVSLQWKTGVTVKNLKIKDFTNGIYLAFSANNTLTGDTISNTSFMGVNGIYLLGSNDNILTGNTASGNLLYGISLFGSNNNTFTNNTTFSNNYGIVVSGVSNILTGNTASGNLYGFVLYWGSDSTILTNNTACDNVHDDFYCLGCRTLTESDNRCDKLYECPISCRPCVGVPSTVDVKPDTLNKGSKSDKNAVTAYIEIPDYDINAIDINTVTLSTAKGSISAQLSPIEIGDYDSDGIPDLMVKFERQAVIGIVDVGDDVKITISGEVGGIIFKGSDKIRVIEK